MSTSAAGSSPQKRSAQRLPRTMASGGADGAIDHRHPDADAEGRHAPPDAVVKRQVQAMARGEVQSDETSRTCDHKSDSANEPPVGQQQIKRKEQAQQELDADEPS